MRRFLLRLLNVFRRERSDEEVTREINVHLALLEDEYVRRGLTADQARLAARRALGSAAHAAGSPSRRALVRLDRRHVARHASTVSGSCGGRADSLALP